MSKLHDLFPTAESVLELTSGALAPILLRIAAGERQRGMFWPPNITQVTIGSGMTTEGQHAYPYHKQQQGRRARRGNGRATAAHGDDTPGTGHERPERLDGA